MITFATLFLGLVLGPQTVGVVVGDAIDNVELHLDGELVATLVRPPWRLQLDFGAELAPHELVAVARDATGASLATTSQWINVPRQPAETQVAIVAGTDGAGDIARLVFDNLAGAAPSAVRAKLDGRELVVESTEAIPLPEYDPSQSHLLQVELEFGDSLSSVAEVVFGGTYGGEVSSRITALPIVLEKGVKLPPVADMGDWFLSSGRPVPVAAVDKGPLDIVVVRDLGAQQAVMRLWREMSSRGGGASVSLGALAPAPTVHTTGQANRRIEFLWPVFTRSGGAGRYVDLFPHSQKFTGKEAMLPFLVTGVQPPRATGEQRLADAVAVAGVTAAEENHRRAVVVVLGQEAQDASDISPAIARRYLEHLAVPLAVWSVGGGAPSPPAWRETVDASTFTRLERASRKLLKELDRQRIVWLEGTHLPQSVTLSERAAGVRIAGRDEVAGDA